MCVGSFRAGSLSSRFARDFGPSKNLSTFVFPGQFRQDKLGERPSVKLLWTHHTSFDKDIGPLRRLVERELIPGATAHLLSLAAGVLMETCIVAAKAFSLSDYIGRCM